MKNILHIIYEDGIFYLLNEIWKVYFKKYKIIMIVEGRFIKEIFYRGSKNHNHKELVELWEYNLCCDLKEINAIYEDLSTEIWYFRGRAVY